KLWQRSLVVFGGPLANFLFSICIWTLLFNFYGQPFSSTTVSSILPGSAAEQGGLLVGDKIIKINGSITKRFEDIQSIVQLGLDKVLTIDIDRNGQSLTLTAKPKIVEKKDVFGDIHYVGQLGISPSGERQLVQYPFLDSFLISINQVYSISLQTLESTYQMIIGVRSPQELTGIVGIAKMSGEIAKSGLIDLFNFMALLSIALGIFNLFPIPLLDGGHLMFYFFEALLGRPLNPKIQEWALRVGLVLLLSLFVFAIGNDIKKLIS
ncbi:MAG: RIP metalloprotease RseP, partial [Alphaproteobacteria bacterium]|nr:RIP metalloprotease RseP [Alphaproteobacteria bacterium]